MSEASFIGLRPYGQIDLDILEELSEAVRRVFPFPVRILDPFAPPDFAYDQGRRQYLSKAILNHLAASAPESCKRILGLTEKDLFIPILTYVYGEAMLPGRAAVVSLHRLTGSDTGKIVPFDILRERVIKEAVHELGHTFSLVHCEEKDCVMSFSHGLDHVDRKSAAFCRYCSVLFSDALSRGV